MNESRLFYSSNGQIKISYLRITSKLVNNLVANPRKIYYIIFTIRKKTKEKQRMRISNENRVKKSVENPSSIARFKFYPPFTTHLSLLSFTRV